MYSMTKHQHVQARSCQQCEVANFLETLACRAWPKCTSASSRCGDSGSCSRRWAARQTCWRSTSAWWRNICSMGGGPTRRWASSLLQQSRLWTALLPQQPFTEEGAPQEFHQQDMRLVQVLERTQPQRPEAPRPAPEGDNAALQMWPTLSGSSRSSLQLPHGVPALSEPAERPLLLPSAAAMQAWDRMEAAEPRREPQQQQAAGWLQVDRHQPQQQDHGRLAAAAAEGKPAQQGDAASGGSGVEGGGAGGAAQGQQGGQLRPRTQQRWAHRRQAVGSGVGRAPGEVQTIVFQTVPD